MEDNSGPTAGGALFLEAEGLHGLQSSRATCSRGLAYAAAARRRVMRVFVGMMGKGIDTIRERQALEKEYTCVTQNFKTRRKAESEPLVLADYYR